MQRSKVMNQSFLSENERFVEEYLARLEESEDKHAYQASTSNFDQQLYHYYAAQNYLANPISAELYHHHNQNAVKLDVPRNNSLTDSMLRTTLGCEEKLAQSYLQIIDQTDKIETESKQRRIEEARKKFASSNCHRDFFANSKAFVPSNSYYVERPVVDNEHDAFLKTQLALLHPLGSKGSRDFIDKFSGNISKKITEMGGLEDTIKPMEHSLSINELTSVKSKEYLTKSKERKNSRSPLKTLSSASGFFKTKEEAGWLSKSREMRSQMSSAVYQ